ncbi:MAG: helix-turn-helix transcriptional regulator, partial [Planktomarina sp.]
METGDNQGAKNVSDTLLNIYECTVSPRKYSNLTQNLGAFLETTQDDTTLEQIENHSETIWPTLTENIAGCFETHSTQPAEFVSDHVQPTGPETDALSKFLSTIYPNDAKRLNTYLKPESQIKETIIRVVSDTDSKTLLYLVRFQNRQMHFFPMTNSIENEVEKLIVDSFNISGSEMMVLRGLVSGLSLKEIAADTGKSIETIRSQMKSLSGKMGLSRQQELASAISTVAKMTLQTSADVQQTAGTEQTITYTKLGDPNGKPVLFVHDFSGGRHWPEA